MYLLLNVLNNNKRNKDVDEMIYRLYEPILFRSLKVANPIVRSQALTLFVSTFPLKSNNWNIQEKEESLNHQYQLIEVFSIILLVFTFR